MLCTRLCVCRENGADDNCAGAHTRHVQPRPLSRGGAAIDGGALEARVRWLDRFQRRRLPRVFIHSVISSFFFSLIHSFAQLTHSLARSFAHSFIHSFNHSFIHSFNSCVFPCLRIVSKGMCSLHYLRSFFFLLSRSKADRDIIRTYEWYYWDEVNSSYQQ